MVSANEAYKLKIAKIYPGCGSVLIWIQDRMGTIEQKRAMMEYAVNRMKADGIMIGWRRQPETWDTQDQLESPLNSGNLNPNYIIHLDQWVQLAQEYKVYIIFQEWFSPMQAKARGEWTGFDDTVFIENWARFYNVLANHFKGNAYIAGFLPGEEVVANIPGTFTPEDWPYPVSGSTAFNALWNGVMTKLSLAVHAADPNSNFIAMPTVDWDAGIYTLGTKAMYPNAWKPLADPSPHIFYRVMWNPRNMIKTLSTYPFDNSILSGAINWHRETGLPITVECLVSWVPSWEGGVWVWDSAGLQWLADLLQAMTNEGIGLNMGLYGQGGEPYATHELDGSERSWVGQYGSWIPPYVPPPSAGFPWKGAAVAAGLGCVGLAGLWLASRRKRRR